MHNLGDQFYAALAAALIFPTHNHHKITIELPFPTTDARRSQIALSDISAEKYMAIDNKIPFYISLGCNHNVVVSSLCGSFWEPDIPCNLVSPWLHPVLKELPYKDGVNNIHGSSWFRALFLSRCLWGECDTTS
ncbi:hypothetical protein BDV34DRAFT_202037 [Aspergillus parasiticus]|uniref:Uncharacterized protein n=1 Tax=Aspergillus parasiticus TaxID=5067 RepID=A0A5N6D9Y5_ASPPA|nr:hypothetical protein BDV34DRAFT_202037 [Aspergillus parasiticus]